jgi:hypothetical protein
MKANYKTWSEIFGYNWNTRRTYYLSLGIHERINMKEAQAKRYQS